VEKCLVTKLRKTQRFGSSTKKYETLIFLMSWYDLLQDQLNIELML